MMARGYQHYSVDTLYSAMRYEADISRGPGDALKLNNNWRSLYARLIEAQESDLVGFFEMRSLASERGRVVTERVSTP